MNKEEKIIDSIGTSQKTEKIVKGFKSKKESKNNVEFLEQINSEAESRITRKCLIAADIDKTYLSQKDNNEKEKFLLDLAPSLAKAATLGTNLAVITGNSMDALCSRFFVWMIEQLCHTNSLHCLDRIHFFCNSGGVYTHFSKENKIISDLLKRKNLAADEVKDILLIEKEVEGGGRKLMQINPEFVVSDYIVKTKIIEKDKKEIMQIMNDAWRFFKEDFKKKFDTYKKKYYINSPLPKDCKSTKYEVSLNKSDHSINEETSPLASRLVRYLTRNGECEDTVQITLKPILSWRHGKNPKNLFNNDVRSKIIERIQKQLDKVGLSHYIARPGGRSSIDVTLEKLDKAYALEYLIDKLNIEGQERKKEKFGSNTIYLGDEVLSGSGNDYSVTRIPGLLVLAVNPEQEFVPFLSSVLVPSAILTGPEASSKVLAEYNRIAESAIQSYIKTYKDNPVTKNKSVDIMNAISLLKKDWFTKRIKKKVAQLEGKKVFNIMDMQTLHAFVTLISREDPAAKTWLSILVKQLDEIMKNLELNGSFNVMAQGVSHPDN